MTIFNISIINLKQGPSLHSLSIYILSAERRVRVKCYSYLHLNKSPVLIILNCSDPAAPPAPCSSNQHVKCEDGTLICQSQQCDGWLDCSQGEDEEDCGPSSASEPGWQEISIHRTIFLISAKCRMLIFIFHFPYKLSIISGPILYTDQSINDLKTKLRKRKYFSDKISDYFHSPELRNMFS